MKYRINTIIINNFDFTHCINVLSIQINQIHNMIVLSVLNNVHIKKMELVVTAAHILSSL